jgi:hypothetical protein
VLVRDLARRPSLLFVSALAALVCALVLPAAASAATYTVDSLGDEPDKEVGVGDCSTSLATCTLRAAIQESNFSTGVKDTIAFDATVFEGKTGDTILLGSALPNIADPVEIDGDGSEGCTTDASSIKGPCVEVSGPNASTSALVVDNADEVTIEGLAVTGSRIAINVINSSSSFVAHGDWLGVKLDGTAGGNTTGIFLDPNSNGAQIGGTTAADRNVFGNNAAEGLDVQGASATQVSGNYFGVGPDGATQAANGKDVEVTSSFTVEAVGNQIGAALSLEALGTVACDGACNVISGSLSSGIDLLGEGGGEEPLAKATTVQGNYIGLTAAGAALGNATIGIQVGKSTETTIGGPAVSANHLNGGTYGVSSGSLGVGADDLVVDGNLIGLNVAGTAVLSPPSTAGIFDTSEGISSLAHTAELTDNRIAMTSGVAIEQHSIGALISGNKIGRGVGGQSLTGGTTGIKLWGPSIQASVVEFNLVANAAGNGILVENNNNLLVGNTIEGSDEAGIRIQDFLTLATTGTAIGGETAESENTISGSGGDAIEVAGAEDDDTQIARNHGSANAGLFIDLGANGSGNFITGPNDGVQPPIIETATVSGASGSGARPGATVRVFRKASASPGELQSFLGKATADGEGKWSLTYSAQIPGGTNVGATQSDVEGTSELSFATTAMPPNEEGGKGGDGGEDGQNTKKEPTVIVDPVCAFTFGKCRFPLTTITKSPKGTTRATTAKFRFFADIPDASFECKLDSRPYRSCRSPKKYKHLKPGKHVFRVRGTDTAGNVGPPAKKKFRILP